MSLYPRVTHRQYGASVLITPPAEEPVTAAELRSHMKLDSAQLSDADANTYITMARNFIERVEGLAIIAQTWEYTLDRWPQVSDNWWSGVRDGATTDVFSSAGRHIFLPVYPLTGVNSITTYDTAGTPTSVVVATVFEVDTAAKPGKITLKDGQVWPTATRENEAIVINYSSSYAADASGVDELLKQAVKLFATVLWTNRGDSCDMRNMYKTSGAEQMLLPYAVKSL